MSSEDQDARVAELMAFISKTRNKNPTPDTKSHKYGIRVEIITALELDESSSYTKIKLIRLNPPLPKRPDPIDCCGSGCTPCIYDAYNDELEAYDSLIKQIEELWNERKKQIYNNVDSEWTVVDINQDIITIRMKGSATTKNNPCLQPSYILPPEALIPVGSTNSNEPALNRKEYRPFIVSSVIHLTTGRKPSIIIRGNIPPDSKQIPRKWEVDVGQHVQIRMNDPKTGSLISRSYTPTTHPHLLGEFELHIRLYPGGALSDYFASTLRVGDSLSVRGPIDSGFSYTPGEYDSFILVAGGSGITPLYQLLLRIEARQPIYPTRVLLIYSITSEEDIWLKNSLMTIASRSQDNMIQILFWLSSVQGRLNSETMLSLISNSTEKRKFGMGLICGPLDFERSLFPIISEYASGVICLGSSERAR